MLGIERDLILNKNNNNKSYKDQIVWIKTKRFFSSYIKEGRIKYF